MFIAWLAAAPLFLLRTSTGVVPRVVVDHAGVVIDRSCTVAVPAGATIEDATGEGVIRVRSASGGAPIVIEFEPGSELWGGPRPHDVSAGPWDQYHGTGIRVEGAAQVTVRNARVHGFKVGLLASRSNGLVVEGGDYSDNYRQHLKSTAAAEDLSDWLYGHHNDHDEAISSYGAAISVRESEHVTIREVLVRRGQNGIALRGVNDSAIYDNDCSFLSGWGLAMWRSSRNMVSRNALDFCVRGHSEGVYNRGQDSAGVLCFEQCCENAFVENSMTHGGDCFFGFAGLEAIGEEWWGQERERLKKELGVEGLARERERIAAAKGAEWKDAAKHSDDAVVDEVIVVPVEVSTRLGGLGSNRNIFVGNDLSYAPAHGLEMTFSTGNVIVGNRFAGNGMTGVWGGYDVDTRIEGNTFTDNGSLVGGEAAGGVVMEHASGTRVTANAFVNNANAVSMWWGAAWPLMKYPGVAAVEKGVVGNVITGNRIEISADHQMTRLRARNEKLVGLRLRDEKNAAGAAPHVQNNCWSGNELAIDPAVGVETLLGEGVRVANDCAAPRPTPPEVKPLGSTHPVGKRDALAGRAAIIMDDWGPWDHASPLVRRLPGSPVTYQVFGAKDALAVVQGEGVKVERLGPAVKREAARFALKAAEPGLWPYRMVVTIDGTPRMFEGEIFDVAWKLRVFPCTTDPRLDLAAYHRDENGPASVEFGMEGPLELDLSRGPKGVSAWAASREKLPAGSNYGITALGSLRLAKGRYRVTTLSDDGVRVTLGQPGVGPAPVLIDRWTHHAPTEDRAEFVQASEDRVEIRVEYFQLDGFATLKLGLERLGD